MRESIGPRTLQLSYLQSFGQLQGFSPTPQLPSPHLAQTNTPSTPPVSQPSGKPSALGGSTLPTFVVPI